MNSSAPSELGILAKDNYTALGMAKIYIGKQAVGDSEPAYVVAEAGVNHNGSLVRAKELIKKAAAAGAAAIKFQTYKEKRNPV